MGKQDTKRKRKPSASIRRLKCGICRNCVKENCGKCKGCVDMPIFGGPGLRKVSCLERKCLHPKEALNTNQRPRSRTSSSKKRLEVSFGPQKENTKTDKNDTGSMKLFFPAPHKKDEDLKSDSKKAPGQKKGNVSSTEIPKSKENLSKPKFSQLPSKSSTMKMSEAVKVQKSGSKAEKLKSVSPATLPKSVSKSDVTFTVKSGDGTPFSQAKDTEHGQARCNPVATNTNYKPSTVLKPAACKTSEHFSSMIRKVRSAPDLKTVQKDQEIESGEKVLTPAKAESPETKKVVLPKVTLDSMSKSELKEFIPRLLKLVTGRATVFHSRRSAKPEWWPEDVPWVNSYSDWFSKSYWADHLKMVVMNCYRYLGQENFLYASGDPRIQQARMSTDEWCDDEDMVNTGSYPSTPVKINMVIPKDLFLPYSAEIYICYFCEKEFIQKDRMHNHQRQCPMRPPELCGFRSEQAAFSRFDENLINPKKSQDIPEQKWSNLPKEKFLPAINLICKTDAAAYMKRRPSAEIDCDIELDGVETKPLSPVHLNSPTTLMSQLSKDESGSARKRLSYSFSVDKDNTNIVDLGSSEDSDDDEQNSDKEVETQQSKPPQLNLLNIPLTSPLGQRVKNHVHVTSTLSIVSDSDSFCRTPVKNAFQEKLRKKALAYLMVYKPRQKANLHKQNHTYKFTKLQRKEFFTKVNYGISLKSYQLLKKMKNVRVKLPKLSRKAFLRWMSRRKLDRALKGKFKGLKVGGCSLDEEFSTSDCEFPSGPCLLAPNIDKLLGLKKKSSQKSASALSLTNCVSEELEAEVSKQKLTLYRSLLYEMSVVKATVVMEDISGPAEGQVQVKQENSADFKKIIASEETKSGNKVGSESYKTLRAVLTNPSSIHSDKKFSWSSVQRSPQDDSASVVSISSGDESLNSGCCSGCKEKSHLHTSGRKLLESPVVLSGTRKEFLEPLSVKIDPITTGLSNETAFPSPVSITSESPYFSTPGSMTIPGSLDEFKTPLQADEKLQLLLFKSDLKEDKSKSHVSPSAVKSWSLRSSSGNKEQTGRKTLVVNKDSVGLIPTRTSPRKSASSPSRMVSDNSKESTNKLFESEKREESKRKFTVTLLSSKGNQEKVEKVTTLVDNLKKDLQTKISGTSLPHRKVNIDINTDKEGIRKSLVSVKRTETLKDRRASDTIKQAKSILSLKRKRESDIADKGRESPRTKRLCLSSQSTPTSSPLRKSLETGTGLRRTQSFACKLDGTQVSKPDSPMTRCRSLVLGTRSKSLLSLDDTPTWQNK
ncbi:uncharacterized protein LOC128217580 [Mya arenaria]|uniref:uncharacterized protein LOC128217580 n=1 Tax=Mya arenaria TaxID=6604 RepID=UPI0022E6F0A3|nr:uncharacterized protein LOC128217580 [Mya arenaria]